MERDALLTAADAGLSELCELEFFKGSGNGGQKRNKTSSAVRVTLTEFKLAAEDCSERSQHRNRANALRKLRRLIALRIRVFPALPPPRLECAVDHADYPLTLAHLLDVLEECGYDHRAAALRLGCTPSALVKKLRRDEELWIKVNTERAARELVPLRAP